MEHFLTKEQQAELYRRLKKARDSKESDRIKSVLLFHKGWSLVKIAEALFLDENTISKHIREYRDLEKTSLASGGSESKLNSEQSAILALHLEEVTYLKTLDICLFVQSSFGVEYTLSGMRHWLKSNGFSFKKPDGRPAKANPLEQEKFVNFYKSLKMKTPSAEPILFADASHPTMETKLAYGWIKKGKKKPVLTTGSRTRTTFIAGIDMQSKEVTRIECKTANAASMINFFGCFAGCISLCPIYSSNP